MKLLNQIKQAFFSPSCVLCEAVSDNSLSLCMACQQDLPWLLHACEHCALPLEDKKKSVCIQCQIAPPIFDGALCALHYSTPVDYLIKRMKFGHQLSHAKLLGSLLSQHASQQSIGKVDAILPVPLHKSRLRQRGFNQSLELAREVSQDHEIPLLTGVTRIVNTTAQTLVKGDDRENNVRDAFCVKEGTILPNHVVILDDVITTGSTSNELARLLKSSGVAEVSVWAVARATS